MRSTVPMLAFFVTVVLFGVAGYLGYDALMAPMPSKSTAAEKPAKSKAKSKKAKSKKVEEESDDDQRANWGTKPAVAGKPVVAGQSVSSGPHVAGKPVSSGATASYSHPTYTGGPFVAGSLAQVRAQADYMTNEIATDRVGWEIVDALEDKPTLAIWLFDRTAASSTARMTVTRRLEDVFKGFDKLRKDGHKAFSNESNGPPLLTAVAAYGKTCDIITSEPTDSTEALTKALGDIREEAEGEANTFAAIKTVLDEYLKFRTKRLIMLTIVSAQRGDDPLKVDELVPTFEKYAIPCYVIGVPAPFGRDGSLSGSGMGGGKGVQVGPESFDKEMIDLDFRNSGGSEVVDSGFGPFALSRLAKESGGTYLIVRNSGGFGGGGRRFDAKTMAKYAPDYVTKADYEALLNENKCRMALHNAAKLGHFQIDSNVSLTTSFVKQDEAKMKNALDVAQRPAARLLPEIEPLYNALKAGESDRKKLTGARWQAAYDVAMGRVLAIKAKYEGYNVMVAQLKQGKRPGGPDATMYMMMPADSFSTDSTMDKLVKQSRKYLETVVKDHPGTPWEMMATREMGTLSGWEWQGGK